MSGESSGRVSPSSRELLEGRIARLLSGLPGHWLLRLIGESPRVVDGLTLDAHVQFILAARRRRPQHLLCEPTVEAGRNRYRREIQAVTERSGARPTRVKAVSALTVDGAAGPLHARLYAPLSEPAAMARPLLVFLHGGGFVLGDLDTHDEPCRLLCQHGEMFVLSVAYRLAPEHPFPAPLDDACAAVRWAQAHAAALGADASQVCVGGDSAGGNLAAVTALTLANEGRAVLAQLLIYPTTNFAADLPSRRLFGNGYVLSAGDMDAFGVHYLGDDPAMRRDARTSPAFSPDLANSPPTLITTADFDPLRDEGESYAEALRDAGVEVHTRRAAGMPHGCLHMTTVVPGALTAVVETARAFKALVGDTIRRARIAG